MLKFQHISLCRCLSLFFGLLLSLCSWAQNILRFDFYSSRDGLSQNTVYSLYCDSKGFLWVGTMNGLNRFDGANFKVYSSDYFIDDSYLSNRIERIWEDNSGHIWSETYDGSYVYFNQRFESFGCVPHSSDGRHESATSFCQYSDSVVFVGAEHSGIYKLSVVNGNYLVENIPVITKPDARVEALLVDSKSNLWVSTDKGLARFSRQQIEQSDYSPEIIAPDVRFSSATCVAGDCLLFGTKASGLLVYNVKSSKADFHSQISPSATVSLLTTIADGSVILATSDAHAFILNADLSTVTPLSYHGEGKSIVENVYVDRFRQAWITTANPGVTRVNLVTMKSRYYELIPKEISASIDRERPYFYEDSQGNLWIGLHGGGLMLYDRNADSFTAYRNNIRNQSSIPSDIVHCIVEDKSGQLWVGTGMYRGGLSKAVVENKAFVSVVPVPVVKTQTDNVVRCIFEDPEHNVWAATKSGRLTIFSLDGKILHSLDGFRTTDGRTVQAVAYSIILHSDGHLYIGTKGEGLFVSKQKINFANLSGDNLTFYHFHVDSDTPSVSSESRGNNSDNIYSLVEDEQGYVWAATYGSGLFRLRFKEASSSLDISSSYSTRNSNLLSDKTRFVTIDSSGNLWVATTNGICQLTKEKYFAPASFDRSSCFTHFVHSVNKPSLSYNDVCYIYEDSRHVIYFATMGGGLTSLSFGIDGTPHYEVFDTGNGLSHNAVYGIVEDNLGNLWVSTESGLTSIDAASHTSVVYNRSTGLVFGTFSESTLCKLSNGSIAFGGYLGFILVSPLHIASTPYMSKLVFTGLSIANREQKPGPDEPITESINFARQITLSYNQSNLSIAYQALDYLAPENIQYAYMLKGLDADWNYVGNQTRAVYTSLQPGDYEFMVKHTYRNGTWSDNVRSIHVVVTAPWWRTWWAYLLYAIVIFGLVYLFFHYLNSINRYQRELSLEKKINEIKLQFFTNIAHEIRTPLTLIVSPIESLVSSDLPRNVHNQLMIIKRNSNRILLLVNQLLDFRKIQNKRMNLKVSQVDLGTFVSQVGDGFTLLADHKHIDFNTVIQPGMNPVWVDTTEIDTVVYNLLSNAMKFTDAGKRVTLSISQDEQYSYIKVIDQGCGIKDVDPDVLFKRYTILSTTDLSGTGIGLSLAYELVELHKGKLLVESEVGKGSTFTVRLLNGCKHFENNPAVSFTDSVSQKRFAVLPDVQIDNADSDDEFADDGRRTLLVVEDNPEILDYLKLSFRSSFNVLTATNGKEALVLAHDQMPSVILSDLMMPVMDGQEMIRHIKDDITTSHIPIIALTAKASTQDEIDALKMGFDAYIPKPFNVEHVKAVINNILTRREQLAAQLAGLRPLASATQAQPLDSVDATAADATAADVVIPSANSSADGADIPVDGADDDSTHSNRGEDQEVSVNILSKDEGFVREMVKFTEDNYRDDLSIDRFAEHFHMSRTVFYNKVKGLTGQSPLEFVRQIKFKIAEQLLQKGYNVSEVAFEIGYSDVKYFSKQFRQQYGVAPSQVKKEWEEKSRSEVAPAD